MSFLKTERDGKVAVVTLNRPERRNALGSELLDLLVDAFAALDNDPAVNAILLAAAGPGFCAGADLKEFSGDDADKVSRLNRRMGAFARSIALMRKPVVAAVDGFAMGGGFVLAASCDVVVTGPATRWRLPEVSLGWLPGFGLQALAVRVGVIAARRLTFASELLNGMEAQALGLADFVSPPDVPALQPALVYARKLAALPPHSVASAKQYFAVMITAGGEPMDTMADRIYASDARHPDAQASTQRFRS